MTERQIIKRGKDVIRIESEQISRLLGSINEEFVKAAECIYACTGRVVMTGMGKSGLIARKIVATLNSTGTPAIYLHPADAFHGDLGMVRKEDVVILISKSGETEDLLHLIPLLKRLGIKLISMTGNESSKMAKEADINLFIDVTEEACPFDLAPTSSTTATLAMGDALSVVLLEMRGFTEQDFASLHPGGSLGKRLSLRLEEIMAKGDHVPVVSETTSLKDAIYEISSKRYGTTAVVDEKGRLSGIITDGDLRRLLEKTMEITHLQAKDIMNHSPKTITREILASRALQLMENYKITSLIVVDEEQKPEGIIHLHELVNLGLKIR
ncbi:MAG: Arabinose 5-phosphate isomerase KdsD [Ignavibacteriaceae bacterium]|nr:Arabinose 5-phosphate isomerase KdsD [Ignavibacteriaceae bacterium]